MAKWTAADMPSLAGRIAVVTGANSGIGFHAARELAAHDARVVLAVRDLEKGEEAARHMGGAVEVLHCDLSDLGSVRGFADVLHARLDDGLDLLVNNAGVMATPYRHTADGFELQFWTNHLGHYALTGLLLDLLLARPEPRVVTVSSGAHRGGRIDFDDLQGARKYRPWRAYAQSKLANLLFAFELQRRADAAGASLTSVAAHPGYAATNLQARGPQMAGSRLRERLMSLSNRVFAQSDDMGALPTLYAATTPSLAGGSYVGPDGLFEQRGHPKLVGASKAATDEATARRLWDVSEELTGVRYDFATPA